MQDLERLRYASRHYLSLQGLRFVPLGLGFIANAWLQRPPGWDVGIALLTLGGGGALGYALGRYYTSQFGYQRAPEPPVWRVAWIPAVFLANAIEVHYRLPVSSIGLGISAIFATLFFSSPRLRWHHGVAAAVILVSSVLPLFGVSSTHELWGQFSRVGWPMFGLLLIVCGILDHLLLRDLFSPRREEMSLEHSV